MIKKIISSLIVLVFWAACENIGSGGDKQEYETIYSVVIENASTQEVQYTFNGKTEELQPGGWENNFKSYSLNYCPEKPIYYYKYVRSIDLVEDIDKTSIKYTFVDIDYNDINPVDINILINIIGSIPNLKLDKFSHGGVYLGDYLFICVKTDGIKTASDIIIPIIDGSHTFSAKMYTDNINLEIINKFYSKQFNTYYNYDDNYVLLNTMSHVYYVQEPPPWDKTKDGKYLLWRMEYHDSIIYKYEIELLNYEFADNNLIINIQFIDIGTETIYGRIPDEWEHLAVNIDDFSPGEYKIQ